jgi:hypothetical protein
LSLFFLACALQPAWAIKGHKKKIKGVSQKMTVAAIRPVNDDDEYVIVTFIESQRFYKLPNGTNKAYYLLLKESAENHKPVLVQRASEQSDVITSVLEILDKR